MMPRPSSLPALLVGCCLLVAGGLSGCRAGGQDLATVNNQLREQNLDLRNQVAGLERRNAELELAVKSQSSGGTNLTPELEAALPRITEITLDRLTTFDASVNPPVVKAYVAPVDGRGRFTQMTGTVTLKLVRVPMAEGAESMTAAERVFEPLAVRDAYRSGFMGTHYTFEMPAVHPSEDEPETWIVVASFVDGLTGKTHVAERMIDVRR